jgi:iterative type I PKS product template protein
VAISARTAASLQNNHARLLDFLERHPETIIADLAYTTTARRMHESLRCAYVGNTTKSIVRQLRLQTEVPRTRPRARGRIFLFTGQGAQYSGMGGDLFRECRSFRETLFAYQEMATGVGLPDFIDLISGQGRVDDDDDDMSGQSTTKAQLAIVALEIALARLMKIWGVVPDVVIGHSLGEYAALCVSGVLSVSDALLLVGRRAALMETHLAADTYAMLATGAEEKMLLDLFGELELSSCSIACVNAPSVTVASGALHDIDTLQRHMEAQGAKTTLLRVPYGFHSGQVEPVLEGLRRVAEGVVFLKPKIPVVSTVTGRVERDSSVFSPAYLARQAREKVDFVGALRSCEEAGLCGDGSLWLEIGPDPVCLGLVRRTLGIPASHLLPTLRSGENNWRTTSDVLRRIYELGGPVSWSELHKPFIGSVTLLNLPTYAFDLRDFWTTYAEPDLSRQPEGGSQQVTEFSRAPGFPTASLQHVEDEKVEGRTITATFTSRISDPQLLDAIRGHVVNGQPICPLGVFHDMALTAAKYVYYRMHVDSKPSDMSIRNVEISQALVASTKTLDSLICVVASTYHAEDKVVDIQLRSRNGGNMSVHGKCQVTFDDNTSWKSSLSQTLFLLNSRIGALRTQALSGKSHRLLKPVVYRLFSGVVSYSPTYQALEEVIMDPGCTDAIGTVALPDVSRLGTFYANPYWTDAVTHLAGFVLNSGLRYPQDTACLAVGFNTWRSVEDLVPGEVYTTYVCMQEVHGSSHVVSGDCYVFRGGELVQATLGINFLRVKKAALSSILGIPDQIAGRRVVGPNKTLDERTAINDDRNIAAEPKPQSRRGEAPGPLVAAAAERDNGGIDPEEKVWSVLSIVASESGCSPEDMTDDTRYADLGVDSVMAITIFAITGRDLGVDLPASFFLENETIGESRRALLALLGSATDEEIGGANTIGVSGSDGAGAVLPEKPAQPRSLLPGPCLPTPPSSMDSSRPPSPSGSADNTETIKLPPLGTGLEQVVIPSSNLRTTPTAKATHYRGPRTADSIKLFFLPDETGSTFGYIHLAAPSGLAVFGVDSPFAADPAAMAGLDIARLADIYVAAVRREQPVGPYVLGGVSAGAVLAFEVARVLLGGGEEVGGLVIVDCAAPTAVWGGRIRESWNSGGGAGGASVRRRGKPGREEHVERILAVLRDYQPVPLASSQNLKVAIQLLARDEVSSRGREREGAPGWADLIPGLQTREGNIETRSFLGVPMVRYLLYFPLQSLLLHKLMMHLPKRLIIWVRSAKMS